MEGIEITKMAAQLTQQVGFPIAVCLWLLWRTDRRLEKIAEVLHQIERTMALIERSINESHD